jgi:hypothetical protein
LKVRRLLKSITHSDGIERTRAVWSARGDTEPLSNSWAYDGRGGDQRFVTPDRWIELDMVSPSATIARRRVFYPRPILAMPDILMIDMPVGDAAASLLPGRYHPVLVETIAEQRELETCLDEACEAPFSPDLLDARPSVLPAGHITVAHYGPPAEDWPYVLLCRWPRDLTAAAPEELRMFVRGAYTVELFDDHEQLEQASDRLLALLRRRRRARVEIILPDWSAVPGTAPH